MANELVHGTVGVGMTQAEFEAVGLHVLNSQATGDLIYASSATQLTRVGIGATNAILTVIGGVPTWQTTLSGLTFVAPALGAATATSVNGLVVTTTAGTLTIANNASAALVTSGNYSITLTATGATNVTLPTTGTLATLAGTEELDGKTLDSSVAKGTWTASGTWTVPAFTLGGAITAAAKNITNTGTVLIGASTAYGSATGQKLEVNGATNNYAGVVSNSWWEASIWEFNHCPSGVVGNYATAIGTGSIIAQIKAQGSDGTDLQPAGVINIKATGTIGNNRVPGLFEFAPRSDDASPDSAQILVLSLTAAQILLATSSAVTPPTAITRLTISGDLATAVATWANITHAGFILSASEKVNPVSGVAGFSVVSTALTLGSAGSVIAPYADMGNAANDTARDTLAGNVNGAVAIDSVGVAGVFKVWCRVGAAWKSATIA